MKAWLKDQETAIPLRRKFSLSDHAAALLQWIVELRPEEYVGTLTPEVEDLLKLDIGIKLDWPDENILAYLAMLVDEINDNADFDLRLQPWHHYSQVSTRIRVKKKPTEMDRVVYTIQMLGLSQNKLLDADRIKSTLVALLTQ